MSPTTTPDLTDGNNHFGPYRLVDRVAVGGMAEVFRAIEARPAGEDRVICVKRMLPHLASEPGALAMFEDEARLGARIRHPNVVQMLGAGESNGQPYLALEYVRGCDLWRLLRWVQQQGLGLPIDTCAYILREMLQGLRAVHDARDGEGQPMGVVHRDVSPSNVLLSVHGDVKLGDLGIAQSKLKRQVPARNSGRHMGKLGYLAPEQVTGATLDVRTDLFSVGVIAAELLMGGKSLFRGGSELAILLAIRDANIEHFQAAARSLPAGLRAFVVQLLAGAPSARHPSAAAALAALDAALGESAAAMSDAPLRRQLGDLVAHAAGEFLKVTGEYLLPLQEAEPTRDALTRADARQSPSVRPLAGNDRDTLVPGPGDLTSDPPATLEVPRPFDICIRGAWRVNQSYAEVVEAIAIGQLQPTDSLRLPNGEVRRVQDIPEFLRHAHPATIESITRDTDPALDPTASVAAEHGGVVVALGRSVLRAETGLWLAEQGSVRKEIYVEGGVPVFVASNMAGELLGEYLVARGVVSRGELDMALAVMPRFEGKLGDTLVALDLVEPVHLFQHIAAQVEEKLLETALWSSGTFSFYPAATAPGERFPLASSPWEILLEATRRRILHDIDPGHAGDPTGERRWALTRTLPRALATSALPEPVVAALALLRQPMRGRDLVAALDDVEGRDVARGARVLTLLAHLGVCVPAKDA